MVPRFNVNEKVRVKDSSASARVYPELVDKKLVVKGLDGAVATKFGPGVADIEEGQFCYAVKPDGQQGTYGILEDDLERFELLDV